MTSREKILDDFRDKFVATIGTAGSKDGMALSTAATNFSKDWSISLDFFKRQLGHNTLQSLVDELRDFVEIRGDRVYAIVNDSNTHVFGLIDRTKKKKRRSKSQSPFVSLSFSGGKRGVHFSKKTSWEQNHFGSRTPRFLSSGGRPPFSTFATPLNLIGTFPSAFRPWQQPLTAATAPPKLSASSGTAGPGKLDNIFSTTGDRKSNAPFQFPRPWHVSPPPNLNSVEAKYTPPAQLLRYPPPPARSCPPKAPAGMADCWMPLTSATPPPMVKMTASELAKPTALAKSVDVVETKKRVLDMSSKLCSSADCWTPTKSPPCKAANVIDRNFQRSGLFRSQLLQIQRVTASSPQSKDSRTIESIKKPVRELVSIIYAAGRSINLEELKKRYYEIHHTDLTGVKLAEVLELEPKKKNHFIAFQSFRPPIFACVLHNADVHVSLSKDCNPLLETMRATGELPPASVPSTSATAAPSNVSTTTTLTSASVRNVDTKPSVATLPMIVRKEQTPAAKVLPALKTPVVVKKFSQTMSTPTYVSKSHSVEPVKKQKAGGAPVGVRMSLSPPQQFNASAHASSASAVTSGTEVENEFERRLSADFSRLTIKDEPVDEPTVGGLRSDTLKAGVPLTAKRDGDTHFHSAHMKSLLDERFVNRIVNRFQLSGSKWKEMKQQFAAINNFD